PEVDRVGAEERPVDAQLSHELGGAVADERVVRREQLAAADEQAHARVVRDELRDAQVVDDDGQLPAAAQVRGDAVDGGAAVEHHARAVLHERRGRLPDRLLHREALALLDGVREIGRAGRDAGAAVRALQVSGLRERVEVAADRRPVNSEARGQLARLDVARQVHPAQDLAPPFVCVRGASLVAQTLTCTLSRAKRPRLDTSPARYQAVACPWRTKPWTAASASRSAIQAPTCSAAAVRS